MAAFTPTGVEFVAKGLNKYLGGLSDADKAQQGLGSSAVGAGKQFGALGTSMLGVAAIAGGAVVVAIGALTAGLVALGAAATREGSVYTREMSNVAALTGAVGGEFDKLRSSAEQLGATTKFTAIQAAEGMSFLAMAGFEVNEIVGAMPDVLNLAAAGNLDLATSANIVSNIMSGFQATADETSGFVDILTATFTSSNTNLVQLGEGMKFVAPIASALGVDVVDLSGAMGKLGDAGIQGTLAGTALRSALVKLSAPTAEGRDLIEKLNIEIFDLNGNMKSLPEVIGEVARATQLMTDEQKTQALETLVGIRNISAFSVLLAEGEVGLSAYSEELRNADSAAEIADRQLDNLAGDVTLLNSAFSGIKIDIFNELEPVLRDIVQSAKDVLENIGPPLVASFGLLADVLSLVIDRGKEFISSFFGDMREGAASLTDFIQALRDTLAGLSGADIMGQLAFSVQDVQSDMISALGELEQASAKTIEAINNEIASSGDVLATTLMNITENFASQAAGINEKFAARMGKINEQIARANEDLGRKLEDIAQKAADARLDIEDKFAEARQRINEQMAEAAIRLEEKIADKKIALAEKVDSINERFAEKQLEIQKKVQDAVAAFQEKQAAIQQKFAREKEGITKKSEENLNDLRAQLAAATTDEERAQIQARIAEEEQARDAALAEVAEREKAELDALQAKHDQAVALLEARLAEEEAARDKAIAKAEAQFEREVQKAQVSHDRAEKALKDRLKREEAQRDKALAKVDRDRKRDEQKAKEANGRKVGDLKKRLAEETAERDKQLAKLKADEQAEIESARQKHDALLTELQARLLEEEAALASRQEAIKTAAADEIASLEETAQARAAALEQFAGPLATIQNVFQQIGDTISTVAAFITENIEAIKGAFIGLGVVLAAAGIVAIISLIGTVIAALATPIGLIVAAVVLLSTAWASNFLGIRDFTLQVWGILQPIFATLVEWLQTTLPLAVQALSLIWSTIFLPAIQAVVTFIQEILFPIFLVLVEWLMTIVVPAILFLANTWISGLMPALGIIWSFLSEILIPVLGVLANIWLAAVSKAVELLAGIWQNILLPQLKTVWAFIQDNVIPILEEVASFISDVLGPAIEWLTENVIEPFIESLEEVWNWIKDIVGSMDELAEGISNIDLGFFTPGSPSPFEVSVRGVDQAMKDLAVTASTQPIAAPVPAMAGGTTRGNVSERTVNMGPTTVNNPMDLAMLREVIKRTINEEL